MTLTQTPAFNDPDADPCISQTPAFNDPDVDPCVYAFVVMMGAYFSQSADHDHDRDRDHDLTQTANYHGINNCFVTLELSLIIYLNMSYKKALPFPLRADLFRAKPSPSLHVQNPR
jgi:hypothetical protein